MTKILGLPFDSFVDSQINTRQTKLAKSQKSPEDLSVFYSNTAWLRLSSGVTLDSTRATTLSSKLGVAPGLLEGTGLARNLVLWGSTVGFTPTGDGVSLDPLRGGVGYGINNAYGFLTTSDQGLKPPPGLLKASVNYKNNGSLKQAEVNIKCFSRSQFEALEAIYLRLGYTMVLEWGNTLWYDNQGNFKRTEGYSIPSMLFGTNGNIKPATLQEKIYKLKSEVTDGNYDAMVGKVTNYSWTLNDDLSFDIKLNLISVGDIIDSLKVNLSGVSENISQNIQVSGSVENLVSLTVNKEASKINRMLYEMFDEIFKDLLVTFGTEETQEAVEVADTAVEQAPKVKEIQDKYLPAFEPYKKAIATFYEGKQLYDAIKDNKATDTQKKRYEAIAAEFKLRKGIVDLNLMYSDYEDEEADVKTTSSKIQQVENYLKNLKSTGQGAEEQAIIYLNTNSTPKEDLVRVFSTGYFDADEKIQLKDAEIDLTPVSYTHLTLPTKRIV